MPIYVYNRLVYVSSLKEFKRGYKNLNNKKRSVSEAIENPGYDLGASVKVLDSLFVQQIDNHKNDFISRIFGFDFILDDARNVVLELLVFFTYFYHKSAKIIDSTYRCQPIQEFLLPYKKFYFKEKNSIIINEGKMAFVIQIEKIQHVRGVINNFVIFLDDYLVHCCSDVNHGNYIKVIPNRYDKEKQDLYRIDDNDYIFERNKPGKKVLSKYRIQNALVLIQ